MGMSNVGKITQLTNPPQWPQKCQRCADLAKLVVEWEDADARFNSACDSGDHKAAERYCDLADSLRQKLLAAAKEITDG